VFVCSLFAVAFCPVLREYLIGQSSSFAGCFLMALAELLQFGLGLGEFGFRLGRPHTGPDQIACECARLELDIAAAGHPERRHVIVWHRLGCIEDLQQLARF
jgi:hypothetical protein